MVSGALQAAIMDGMDGYGRLAGWRWLFVVNGVLTVVLSVFGVVMIPDLPNNPNPRAFWFRKRDAELSMERLARHNRAEPRKMTLAGVK